MLDSLSFKFQQTNLKEIVIKNYNIRIRDSIDTDFFRKPILLFSKTNLIYPKNNVIVLLLLINK
jgi:hypothetical protein